MYHKGLSAESRGDTHTAQTCYARAVKADPACVEAWVNLGTIQMQLGGLTRAEFCYRQALAVVPNYALARYDLACCLQEQERHEEARSEYEQVIYTCPEYFDALYNLGHMYLFHYSHPEEALRYIRRCERLRPQDPHLLSLKRAWARWHRDMGWEVFQVS